MSVAMLDAEGCRWSYVPRMDDIKYLSDPSRGVSRAETTQPKRWKPLQFRWFTSPESRAYPFAEGMETGHEA